MERGAVREFDGDLESYRQLLSASRGEDSPASQSNQSRREQRRIEAEARAKLSTRRRPLETQVRRLEKDIEALSIEKERLENLIASPDLYDPMRKDELQQYQYEQARVAEQLGLAEERWLELSDELENLTAGG